MTYTGLQNEGAYWTEYSGGDQRFCPIKKENNIFWSYKSAHFGRETVQTWHNKKGQNETFVFMQNLRSFPAKMAIFLATRNIFPILRAIISMEKLWNLRKYLELTKKAS